MNKQDFGMILEADVFHTMDEFESGQSRFGSEKRLGWVSLKSEEAQLTDTDVFNILCTAQAEQSLAREFGSILDDDINWLNRISSAHNGQKSPASIHTRNLKYRNIYVSGHIDGEYLADLCTEFDDGGKVLLTLMKFDTPIEAPAESIIRSVIEDREDFSNLQLYY